jgi:uncharacterized protein
VVVVEHPNALRLRAFYDALSTGDAEALLNTLSPDVRFHVPGDGMLAGEYEGIEAVATLGLRAAAETNGTFKFQLLDVIANDTYAVGRHLWTAERRGRRIEMNNINAYRFDVEGKIVERWEFIEDQRTHDDFWAPEQLP